MRFTSKVKDNQKSVAFLASSFVKQKKTQLSWALVSPVCAVLSHNTFRHPPCNLVAVDSIARDDFHVNK